eukprot:scaffold129647_cov44-Prasinocladus_malaysianus.AAC.1
MKTDPKNSDYTVEHGATRNYEPWRDKDQQVEDAVAAREAEEMGNAMKALENRTIDSKREMDIMSALDEMRALKAKHFKVDTESALAALKKSAEEEELLVVDEDEAAVRELLEQRKKYVKRLEETDEASASASAPAEPRAKEKETKPGSFGVSARPMKMMFKPKRKADDSLNLPAKKQQPESPPPAGVLGLGDYGSSGSDSG